MISTDSVASQIYATVFTVGIYIIPDLNDGGSRSWPSGKALVFES